MAKNNELVKAVVAIANADTAGARWKWTKSATTMVVFEESL